MIEVGESAILKISPPWFTPVYEPSKRRLTWPNGVIATIFSGDEPGQLRGPQHGSAWVDELAKFKYPDDTWSNLVLGLRLGDDPRVVVTTTPRPIPAIKDLAVDDATVTTTGSTFENAANLAPSFLREVMRRYGGTRLGEQELYGRIMGDTPGALWTREVLEKTRIKAAPDAVRIVVGIDPGASTTESANNTGIVAAGIDGIRHGIVLSDATMKGKPAEWGEAAVRLYDRLHADCVVGEVNNGGDMVQHVVETAAAALHARGERPTPAINFKQVRASRGKYTRAEPISAMYGQGVIHNVGLFPDLEDELCTWVPGEDSPDRLDAMVWALTELMLNQPGEADILENMIW